MMTGNESPGDSEPPERYDVIVVGLGIMGLSVCWRLAQRGIRVLGLEQFDLLHDHGSSHGSTRVIRKAYFEHPNYVPLMERAYEGWRELEAEADDTLLNMCGVLSIGCEDSRLIRGLRKATALHGLSCEDIPAASVNQRFPGFTLENDPEMKAIFEPEGGYIYAQRARNALVNVARSQGATLVDCCHVENWTSNSRGVEVETEEKRFHAQHLILTQGPWAKPILANLGIELTLVRKLLFWYMPADVERAHPQNFPCFAAENENGVYYGVPDNGDTVEDGIKIARHDNTPEILDVGVLSTGDEMLVESRAEEQEEIVRPMVEEFARKYLTPALLSEEQRDLVPSDSLICQYSLTPDGHFIIDRHPNDSRVSLAVGFSGHGFKFAPLIGEIMADLATGKQPIKEAEFLGLKRFAVR